MKLHGKNDKSKEIVKKKMRYYNNPFFILFQYIMMFSYFERKYDLKDLVDFLQSIYKFDWAYITVLIFHYYHYICHSQNLF